MTQPLTVSIPHQLGRAEALRRIKGGLERVRDTIGPRLAVLQDSWTGDHMDFRIGALGQTASGSIDVGDAVVRLEVQLPWVLARLAEATKRLVEKQGRAMLEKPPGKS